MRDADTVHVMHVHIVHALCEGTVMSIQFRNGPFTAIRPVELDRLVDPLDHLVSSGRPWGRRDDRHQGKQKHPGCDKCALEHDSSTGDLLPAATVNSLTLDDVSLPGRRGAALAPFHTFAQRT